MPDISVPALSLVVLVGVSGSGKSTFAARNFAPTQVLSSDVCRGLVADDENDQSATSDAFDVLAYIAGTRLRRGLLTVVDATNVQRQSRKTLIDLAKSHDVLVDAIVLDVSDDVAIARNATRPDRDFGPHVIRRQHNDLRRSLSKIRREGFRRVHVLTGVDEIDSATVTTEKAWTDKRELTGPFDIIGDVHGCRSELETLLRTLGWTLDPTGPAPTTPRGGPRCSSATWSTADRTPRACCAWSWAWWRPEPRCAWRATTSRSSPGHCTAATSTSRTGSSSRSTSSPREPDDFRRDAHAFVDGLISHYELDGGRLVVAHAGLKEAYHGRASGRVRSFALYGDTTGETDEYGLPVRYPWARDYRGPSHGRLRPHTRAGDRMDQQHHLPRHRRRFRWSADRAALSQQGSRFRSRRAGVVRVGATARHGCDCDRRGRPAESDAAVDRRRARHGDTSTSASARAGSRWTRRTPPLRSRS